MLMEINKFCKVKGFSLVEIVIVILILALLTILVVVLLDPADFFPGARDTRRISDLQAIDSALSMYRQDVGAFFPSASVAADPSNAVIGLVRQDCTGYSNCFTSLAAWQTAFGGINFGACTQGNLVCAGKSAVAKIDGAWTAAETSTIVINDEYRLGWRTGPNNYIKIYTTPTARHNGKWDTNKYRLDVSGIALAIRTRYVRIDGLQLKSTNNVGYSSTIQSDFLNNAPESSMQSMDIRISNNIITGNFTRADEQDEWGIDIGVGDWINANTTAVFRIWNNIIYTTGIFNSGAGIVAYGGTEYVYNNTVYNTPIGFNPMSAVSLIFIAKNNIAQNNSKDGYRGNFASGSDYNLSGDNTSTGGAHDKKNQTVSFVSTSTKDFHLASTDTAAKGAGANVCSIQSNGLFNNDIDGDLRGGVWDIGADQVVPNYNIVFTSLPDNNSACCTSYSMPSLPSDWTYSCVSETGLQSANGTGWIPVDFTKIPGNILSSLPVDPNNLSASGQYYTFVTDGKKWELTSILESDKNKGASNVGGKDGGQNDNILEIGSNLTLTPLSVKSRQ